MNGLSAAAGAGDRGRGRGRGLARSTPGLAPGNAAGTKSPSNGDRERGTASAAALIDGQAPAVSFHTSSTPPPPRFMPTIPSRNASSNSVEGWNGSAVE